MGNTWTPRAPPPLACAPPGPIHSVTVNTSATVLYKFPSSLEGFGFKFTSEGKLVETNGGSGFKYKTCDDDDYCKERYKAIAKLVVGHVTTIIEENIQLNKLTLPVKPKSGEKTTYIYITKEARRLKKVMILMSSTGELLKPGIWSESVVINEGIEAGSQIPYIKRAIQDGYGVFVLNPNDLVIDGKPVRGNSSPTEHLLYVWDKVIMRSRTIKHVAIVADRTGVQCVSKLVECRKKQVKKKLFAVTLTGVNEEVHLSGDKMERWLYQVGRGWVTSRQPLNTEVPMGKQEDHFYFSAGTEEQEATVAQVVEPAMQFLSQKYEDATKSGKSKLLFF